MIRTPLAASLGLLVAFAGAALAQPPEVPPHPPQPERLHTRAWKATPLVGTTLGADVAAGIQVEAPNRLRVMATVGQMPELYAWGVSQLYSAVNTDRELVGDLLQNLTAYALVVSANASWRLLPQKGFFVGAGYTLVYVNKSGLLAATIEQGTSVMLPESEQRELRRFDTTVHADIINGLIGWEWAIGSGFMLRASFGVSVPVHSNTELKPDFVPMDPVLTKAFTTAASRKLEDAGTWIIVPTLSVHLGYTFY